MSLHPNSDHHLHCLTSRRVGNKNRLMNLPLIIGRVLIIVFFALVSYGLTGSIAVKSTMGIVLAIISLGATVVFLYLLPKLYERPQEEERVSE
jgi:uncharacterized membrane protein